jgi:hypothetical protein
MDSDQRVVDVRLRTAYNLILGPKWGGIHSDNVHQTSVLEVSKVLSVFVYHN